MEAISVGNRRIPLLGTTLATLFLALFALVNAPLTQAEGISPAPVDSLQPMEAQLLTLLNNERIGHGVAPLAVDGRLEELARQRSDDMATRNYFSHTTPDGTMVFDQMNAEGIPYQMAGENIARNHEDPAISAEVAHDGFVNSPEHAENDLDPSFNSVGIGVAVARDGTIYFTELFAELPQ
jgi:uncharacterized protein YkwD